ncbi:UPF0262 family protein [Ochrobactrum quorumnocens]|nr:UPF0262 family protein [[Ochrobactrum] quorumnocens]
MYLGARDAPAIDIERSPSWAAKIDPHQHLTSDNLDHLSATKGASLGIQTTPDRPEAIDMGRRIIHNDAAVLLGSRFSAEVDALRFATVTVFQPGLLPKLCGYNFRQSFASSRTCWLIQEYPLCKRHYRDRQ